AVVYTAVASSVAYLAYTPPDLSTEAMLLILGTAFAALHCGRGPSILAAIVSAAVFNFLFIEPRFSFSVGDPSYLIAFGVMAIVAFVLSSLVSQGRERAEIARERQRETEALYSLTRELTSAEATRDVARITVAHLR